MYPTSMKPEICYAAGFAQAFHEVDTFWPCGCNPSPARKRNEGKVVQSKGDNKSTSHNLRFDNRTISSGKYDAAKTDESHPSERAVDAFIMY